MQGKTLMIIFGIVILVINIIATLLSFGISISFLSFMPGNMMIYTIASGVLALIMIVIAINPQTY